MIHKLKDAKGFSFVEALCATLMLSLLGLMMGTGIQMAMKSYFDVTAESETQLLVNSLSNALCDKLRYSVVTKKADGTKVCSVGEIKIGAVGKAEEGRIVIEKISADGTKEQRALLPKGAYGQDGRYRVTEADCTIAFDNDANPTTATFTVKVKVEETSGIGAETELTVRCLNPVKIE